MPSDMRERIKRSFLKLLDERPLSQVTVKAIVEDCGINRNSFYYYFADIPSLLEAVTVDNAERLIAEHAETNSIGECMAAATSFARENRRAVLHIYRSARRDLFEQYLSRVCREMVLSYCTRASGDFARIDAADREIMVRYYQCELMGQTLLWLENDMRYDIQAQFDRLLTLRRGFGAEMVRRSLESGEKQD